MERKKSGSYIILLLSTIIAIKIFFSPLTVSLEGDDVAVRHVAGPMRPIDTQRSKRRFFTRAFRLYVDDRSPGLYNDSYSSYRPLVYSLVSSWFFMCIYIYIYIYIHTHKRAHASRCRN
jgi:hypothetical protein